MAINVHGEKCRVASSGRMHVSSNIERANKASPKKIGKGLENNWEGDNDVERVRGTEARARRGGRAEKTTTVVAHEQPVYFTVERGFVAERLQQLYFPYFFNFTIFRPDKGGEEMGELKQYTFEDVRKCNSQTSTILVIYNKVYDLTEFLNEHPGGEEVLLDHVGKDATEDFNDVGHSTDAVALMKKYQVGEIVEAERRNVQLKSGWPLDSASKPGSASERDSGLTTVVIIGAVLLGMLATFYLIV